MIEFLTGHFCLTLHSIGLPSCALVDFHLERDGMLLHDAIGVNYQKAATTENKEAGAGFIG